MVDSFQVFPVNCSSYIQRNSILNLSGRYQMPLRVCMQRCLPRHQHGSNQINQEVRPVHCWSQRTLLCPSGITLYIFSLIWASRSNEVPFQVEESGNIPDMDRIWIKGWFPILFELSCIVSRYVGRMLKLCTLDSHLSHQVQARRANARSHSALWYC